MLIQLTDLLLFAALFAGAVASYLTRKLTHTAAFTGFLGGIIIYFGAGYTGICCLAFFFFSGTLATAWGRREKQVLEKSGDSTQRTSGQVLANSGAATLFALLALIFPAYAKLFILMLAASFSSATSDTLSSELGMLYGRRFYNCLTWKKEASGLDGVVSFEGTMAGFVGTVMIAIIYAIGIQFNSTFLLIIFAGMAGNFADSFFGATLERKSLLNNDMVNFFSTLVAAGIACLIYLCIN